MGGKGKGGREKGERKRRKERKGEGDKCSSSLHDVRHVYCRTAS